MDNAGDTGAVSVHIFACAWLQMYCVTIRDERQIVDEFQSLESGVRNFDPAIQDGHSNPLASSPNDGGSRLL
jgi:hypothetical protein